MVWILDDARLNSERLHEHQKALWDLHVYRE